MHPDTVRVVKSKWDGTVSTVTVARVLAAADGDVGDAGGTGDAGGSWAWLVAAGSRMERAGRIEVVESDELWVAVPGEWWVLCVHTDAHRSVTGYLAHASAPFQRPSSADRIDWLDLDLDFEVAGDRMALRDEEEFHAHARTMDYPRHVVRGAWTGIAAIASRFTNGEWPFDGSIERHLATAADALKRSIPAPTIP